MLIVLATLLVCANALLVLQVQRQGKALLALQEKAEDALRRAREMEAKRVELIEKQHIAEQLVDHGSIGVETVHKAVAGLTFGILEAMPGTAPASRSVREAHDLIAGESYEAIRKLNRQVGKFLKEALNPDADK